jgi:hypothetical protein
MRLEGYVAPELVAGQASPLQVVWRVIDAAKLSKVRFSEFAHLVDGSGKVWSRASDSWNVSELWRDGDLVVWPVDLNVSPDAPLGGYWLETGFYDSFSQKPLELDVAGKPAGSSIRIGPLRLQGPPPSIPASAPIALFGANEVGLLDAHWEGSNVVLDWQAEAKPRASYTVFVHVLDGAGKIVAQQDSLPAGGSYPTDLWQTEDIIRDVHALAVPAQAGLRLEVGLYTQPDVQRLPVSGPGLPKAADHLVIDAPRSA